MLQGKVIPEPAFVNGNDTRKNNGSPVKTGNFIKIPVQNGKS